VIREIRESALIITIFFSHYPVIAVVVLVGVYLLFLTMLAGVMQEQEPARAGFLLSDED